MNEGKLYNLFIDPFLDKAHQKHADKIPKGATVIDVACGNGTLALKEASRASFVKGIDLSAEMIQYANYRISRAHVNNLECMEMDARNISQFGNEEFDVASISMAIHQFDPETAISLLKEMKRIAMYLLILDYQFPLSTGFSGMACRIIERMAGKEHNSNFIKYNGLGGLPGILKEACPESTFSYTRVGSIFTVASNI